MKSIRPIGAAKGVPLFITLVAGSAGLDCHDEERRDRGNRFELSEVTAWATSEEGRGLGTFLRGDTVLVWSLSGRLTLLTPNSGREALVSDSSREFVGGRWNGDTIEVLARSPIRRLLVVRSRGSFETDEVLFPYELSGPGWVRVAHFDSAWHAEVVDGVTTRTTVLGPERENPLSAGQAAVTGDLREARFPMSAAEWVAAVSSSKIGSKKATAALADTSRFWRARGRLAFLGIVPLDQGEHMLTVGDLGSDLRWLVRIGRSWETIKTTELDAPISVLATDTTARSLLMARDLGTLELVLYRWSR